MTKAVIQKQHMQENDTPFVRKMTEAATNAGK
jgi:hypothetical protein